MGYIALTQARTVRQHPWATKLPAWGPLRTPASPARPPGRRRGAGSVLSLVAAFRPKQLLRQPSGFEGGLLVQEQSDAPELAVLDAHGLKDRSAERKPAPWRIDIHAQPDEDLVPGGHELIEVNLHGSEDISKILKVRGDGVGALEDATIWHPRRILPLKVIAPERPGGVEAACVPGVVVTPHDLYVLLRHDYARSSAVLSAY